MYWQENRQKNALISNTYTAPRILILITSLWKSPSEVPTWITALIFILLCRCINGHKLMSDSNKCVWHVGGNKLSYLQKMNLLDTIDIFCCCFMSQWLNYCIVNWWCYKKISGEDKIPGIFQIVCNKLKSVDKQIENKNKNVCTYLEMWTRKRF